MNILYFIPPLLILGIITWKRSAWGIYIILAAVPAFLLRTQVWFVPTSGLELGIYVVALVVLIRHIQKRTLESHWFYVMHKIRPYVIPVTLLCIALLISTIISPTKARALGIVRQWFFDPILFGIVFLDLIQTKKAINKTLIALTLGTLPIIIYGLYDYIVLQDLTIAGRLDSFFASPNYVAMYLVPLIVLIAGTIITQKHLSQPTKLYYLLWLVPALGTFVLTKSFGGLFGLMGGMLFIILFNTRITLKRGALILALFILASFGGIIIYKKSFVHYDQFWQVNSLETRKEIWFHSLNLVSQNPIFGIGLGNYKNTYRALVESLPPDKTPVEIEVLRPHNVYLDFWLETGLLGIIAFLWILVVFYEHYRAGLFKHKKVNLVPTGAAMTALLIHGLVDTPYFKNDLALLFWIIILIHVSLKLKSPTTLEL